MQLDNDVDLICRVIPVVLDTLNQQQSLFCGILTFEDIGTLPFAFRNPQSVEKVQNLEDPRLSNLPKHRVPILSMTDVVPWNLQIHGFVFPSRRTLHTESQADETRFCEIAVKRLCTWPRIVRPREQCSVFFFISLPKPTRSPFIELTLDVSQSYIPPKTLTKLARPNRRTHPAPQRHSALSRTRHSALSRTRHSAFCRKGGALSQWRNDECTSMTSLNVLRYNHTYKLLLLLIDILPM